MSMQKRLMGLVDARSNRGIFSRGNARFGPSGAAKPANLQELAKKRLKKMQGIRNGN